MPPARFAPELASAEQARRFVERQLARHDVGEEALFRAQLVATEFVTNAARHAHSPVELSVERGERLIRIEARDDSTATPKLPSVDAPTRHRGVLLIQDLCEQWGVDVQQDTGKTVWCELRAPDSRPC